MNKSDFWLFHVCHFKIVNRSRCIYQTSKRFIRTQCSICTTSPSGCNLIIAHVYIPYHTQNCGLNGLYHVLWAWCSLNISWPESEAAGSPNTKSVAYLFRWRGKADLHSHCRRKRWNVLLPTTPPLNSSRFKFHDWSSEEQIVHQIYSKIQLLKACYCCVIYGIRTKPSQAKAYCLNDIHECH